MCLRACVSLYVYAFVCLHVRACAPVCVCVRPRARVCVYMHSRACFCVLVRVRVPAPVSVQVLYMSNNNLKDMTELNRLNDLLNLREVVLVGNPLEEQLSAEDKWREVVAKALGKITKLDGSVVIRPGD